MKTLDFTRQSTICAPDVMGAQDVTVIGAGGIGSWVVLGVAKMGVGELQVWDHDKVEPHNAPSQLYGPADDEWPKVVAANKLVAAMTGREIDARNEKHQGTRFETPLVIAAVDSMRARESLWRTAKRSPQVRHYIDGRMSAHEGVVWAVEMTDAKDREQYEASLYSDAEAQEVPCTERAIVDNCMMMAATVCRAVLDITTAGKAPRQTLFHLPSRTMMAFGKPEEVK